MYATPLAVVAPADGRKALLGTENTEPKFTNRERDSAGGWLRGNGNTLIWKTDYLDHLTDFESIVWIHEFGHNLGLCHRPGDEEAQALDPTGAGICTAANSNTDCNCG